MIDGAVSRNETGIIEVHIGDHDIELPPIEAVKLAFLLLKYSGVPMSVDLMNRILGNFNKETVN